MPSLLKGRQIFQQQFKNYTSTKTKLDQLNAQNYLNLKKNFISKWIDSEPETCMDFALGMNRQLETNYLFKKVHDTGLKKVRNDIKEMSAYLNGKLSEVQQTMQKSMNL